MAFQMSTEDDTKTGTKSEYKTELVYSTKAYLCDPTTGSAITKKIEQGNLITVCVRPDDRALADGVLMHGITDFEFTRGSVKQVAVVNGVGVNDGISFYEPTNCLEKGYCTVSTVLLAKFFNS